MAMSDTSVSILGTSVVATADRELDLTGRLPGYVLTMLVLRTGHIMSIEDLVRGVYGDRPPPTATSQLQAHISYLRRFSGPVRSMIETMPGGYRLRRSDEASVDLWRFEDTCESARAAVRAGDWDLAHRLCREGWRLWREPALPDPFSARVDGRLSGLRSTRDQMLDGWAEAAIRLGQSASLVPHLREAVAERPLDERLRELLIRALYRAGAQHEAIGEYQDIRTRLADELGLDPGWDLKRVFEQVLSHDQTLSAEAPATSWSVPRQLPIRPTRPTVRAGMVARVGKALRHSEIHDQPSVVVLSGPRGCGKTTVGIEAAHVAAGDFPDGQIFVALGGVTDPASVLGAVLLSLGERPDAIPPGLPARSARYRSLLAGKRVLVVLDGATSSPQVAPLLPAGPGCAALVTATWAMPELQGVTDTVGLGPLSRDEAWRLLAGYVGAGRLHEEPDAVDAVITVCAASPLALDLIGARMAVKRHLGFGGVSRRLGARDTCLDELELGGRGVRVVMDEAYRWLSSGARSLLRKIGFLGVDGITASTAADVEGTSVLAAEDRLEELVDAGLLSVGRGASRRDVWYRCGHLALAFGYERARDENRFAVARTGGVGADGPDLQDAVAMGVALFPCRLPDHDTDLPRIVARLPSRV